MTSGSSGHQRRSIAGGVLSLVGGLIVLAVGIGLVEVRALALSGNLLQPSEGLIGQAYTPMLGTGFAQGSSFLIGVITGIIPGMIMVVGAIVMLASPSRANRAGYLVLAFAYISLVGVGGFAIGALLGIFGGSIGILSGRSAPKLIPPPRPGLVNAS
jgi:hypothetical protein